MSHTIPGKTSKTEPAHKNNWRTSNEAFNDARVLTGIKDFDLDAAANADNARANRFLNEVYSDALDPKQNWLGDGVTTVWCNPPFDKKKEFLRKAYEESQRETGYIVMMIPFEAATSWWMKYVRGKATAVFIPDGRYNFLHPVTGQLMQGVPFASCFVVFTPLQVDTQYIHFNRGVSLLTVD